MIYKSKSQTLITGTYRTGSEYLSQLINCNPEISVSMYAVNVLRFIFGKFDPINDKSNYTKAIEDISERLKDRYKIDLNVEDVLKHLNNKKDVDYGTIYDAIMSSIYIDSPIVHWAEKNQLLWREIPQFLKMMPNGKAIHILRDPRSVLLSFKNYTYVDPPGYVGAIFNCYDSMMHAVEYQKTLPKDRYYVVRYEDLVLNTQDTVNSIWDFLDLSKDIDVNDRKKWTDAYGKPWYVNSSFCDNTEKSSYDTNLSMNRWMNKLSPAEIGLTEGVCGELMHKFDYSLSRNEVDWLDAIKLIVDDETMMTYYRDWLLEKKGIEAFPTNPLLKENWEENRSA
jgi:hypothetical protein